MCRKTLDIRHTCGDTVANLPLLLVLLCRKTLDIRRAMRAGALQQDRFFSQLREASDGFGVVAEHFGRGLMNMTAASVQQQAPPDAGL